MHALVIENCCLLVHETFVNVLMENICILVLKFCQFNIFDYQQENNTFFFVQTSKSNSVCLMKQIKFFRRPLLHDTWRIYHFRVKNCFRSWLFLLRTLWPWGLAIEFSGIINTVLGFPHSSVGKESACNAGDPGLIPGSGRSTGEGIGYPLQYSWASLVTQLVKNLPAMWETWIQSLGWQDPLEKGKTTDSSILAWRIAWTI